MPTLHTDTTIHSAPHEVWTHLTDFPRWENWNPFLSDVRGAATTGDRVSVTLQLDQERMADYLRAIAPEHHPVRQASYPQRSSTYRCTVTANEPDRLLAWASKSWWRGSYAHRFELYAVDEGTLLRNVVTMKGLLPRIGWHMIKVLYLAGIRMMNDGLKAWTESAAQRTDGRLFEQRNA